MDLDLSVDRDVRVIIRDYLNKIVSDFSDKIQGILETLSAEHLFTVREDTGRKVLDKDWATAFNHSVAQLLLATTALGKISRHMWHSLIQW